MYKTERFSHKSGCAMWFAKHLEETGLATMLQLKRLYTYIFESVVTKAQDYEVCSKKYACCYVFLVMSLSSHDFLRCQQVIINNGN